MADFSSYEEIVLNSNSTDDKAVLISKPRARIPESKDIIIQSHDGRYHADDVISCYVLKKIHTDQDKCVKIIRDRSKNINADFTVDVGYVHDPPSGKYDHHQFEKSNSLYGKSALGLIWDDFGVLFIKGLMRDTGLDVILNDPSAIGNVSAKAARIIESTVVKEINEIDVNTSTNTRMTTSLSRLVTAMNPNWYDKTSYDISFMNCIEVIGTLFSNLCKQQIAIVSMKIAIECADISTDGKVMLVNLPCSIGKVFKEHPRTNGVKLIITPRDRSNNPINGLYRITVLSALYDPDTPDKFPISWWGKQSDALGKITNILSVRFCHKKGILVEVNGLTAAMKLAGLALRGKI